MPSNGEHAEPSWLGRVECFDDRLRVLDVLSEDRASVNVPDDSRALLAGTYVLMRGPLHGPPHLVEVLAEPGTARAQIYDVVANIHLSPTFPVRCEAEVDRILQDPGIQDPALQDLTELPFVTVDDAHTRDLDQALFVQAITSGCHGQASALARGPESGPAGYRVWYALADASFYVRPGMALFDEALRRGASIYLPGVVIPMLPRALSESLISLNEGSDRRATVFRMDLDPQGRPVATELIRARIRSRAKLSFDEVQDLYDAPDQSPLAKEPFAASLGFLRDVGRLRLRYAELRNVVQYRRAEVDIGLDGDKGLRFVTVNELRRDVERYNEQVSLLCNIEGARFLYRGDRPDDDVQPVYRVHPRPNPQRIEGFEELLESLCASRGLDPRKWTWRRGSGVSLAAFLASLPGRADAHEDLERLAHVIHRQAVLLNMRSSFSEEAGEHYGVGAELYARFSSPMREIVGIFVHKEAWEKVTGQSLPARWLEPSEASAEPTDDDVLRRLVVEKANECKEAQKQVDKQVNRLVLDDLFGRDHALAPSTRPYRRGTIMGLTRSKAHVLLDHPSLDVKVYVAHVGRALRTRIEIDDDELTWVAKDGTVVARVGDAVTVTVQGRDERRNLWELGMTIAERANEQRGV